MSTSAVRCRVVLTVVPLLLLPFVVSNVEGWTPKATTPLRLPVGDAVGPVIAVSTGGVMGTVTSTNAPLANEATVQSTFVPLRTQVAPVATPATSGVVT